MSNYYHDYVFDFFANDIITIKPSYDVPIILLGDFNSITNIATNLADIFEHEGSILEENTHKLFFENRVYLIERIKINTRTIMAENLLNCVKSLI